MKKTFLVFVCILPLLLAACASTPPVTGLMSLEEALAGAIASVEARAQNGSEIALAKIASPLTALSDFLGSELENRFNATGKLTVLARGQTLENVNAEQVYQMSGMVSDESAVGIGHYLGAKVVITGDFNRFGNFSQFYIRAVDVKTAQVLTVYSAKIDNRDPVLAGVAAPLMQTKTASVSEELMEYLYMGQEFLAAGLHDIAIEEFNKAIAKNRNFAEAYYYRGNTYRDKGDKDQAIKDYSSALRIDRSYVLALNNRGNVYAKKKDYDRAIADFTAALRHDPNFVEALLNRSYAYYDKEDYDRALADSNALLRINPNNVYALWNRARVYLIGKDDARQAIADYTEAIRVAPDNAYSYQLRGFTYSFDLGLYDLAIADFTQALRIDSSSEVYAWADWLVYDHRANAYKLKGDYNRAISDYSQVINLRPDGVWGYLNRADAYLKIGDVDRAFEDYDEAEYIDPNNGRVYYMRGNAFYDLGEYFDAESDYEEALRLDPNNNLYKMALEKVRKETDMPPPPPGWR